VSVVGTALRLRRIVLGPGASAPFRPRVPLAGGLLQDPEDDRGLDEAGGSMRRITRRPDVLVALLLASGCASATPDWREVRLVRDRADLQGCTLLTILKDEDMDDLRRKAAEAGGDTVLVTGSEGGSVPVLNPTRFVADVYRCRAAR
jgi:hypothetical protein